MDKTFHGVTKLPHLYTLVPLIDASLLQLFQFGEFQYLHESPSKSDWNSAQLEKGGLNWA